MSDQAFLVLSTIVAWLALGVLVIALLADWVLQRFNKRRRCPRCWYSMHGTPGLTCSECGYSAKRERRLFKARRRWRLIWLALLMLAGSYALRIAPGVKDRGWAAAVPTTAIIAAAPWLEPYDNGWKHRDEPEPPVTLGNRLAADLLEHRAGVEPLWEWQERWLVERCLEGDAERVPPSWQWNLWYGEVLNALWVSGQDEPWWFERANALVDVEIETRDVWPVGEDIYGKVRIRRWNTRLSHVCDARPASPGASLFSHQQHSRSIRVHYSNEWHDWLTSIGRADQPQDALEFDVLIRAHDWTPMKGETYQAHLRRYHLQVPIRITDNIEDLRMTPAQSEHSTQALRTVLVPRLERSRRGFMLDLWNEDNTESEVAKNLAGITFGVRYQLRHDEKIVCHGTSWSELRWHNEEIWGFSPMGPVSCSAITDASKFDGRWTVTLKGELVPALRNLDCDRYWVGEITLPVEVVER